MKQTLGVLRALGVLLGIWAVLFTVGLVAGVIPAVGRGTETSERAERTEQPATDGGAPTADARAAARTAPRGDGGTAVSRPEPVPPAGETIARYTACDAAVRIPELGTVQLVGSPIPEIALGCDGFVHVIAVDHDDTAITPLRVVTFDAQHGDADAFTMHAGAIAAGDVDDDSLEDVVVPFWQSGEDGSARGGRLYLVRREPSGAFGEPRLLGPVAASDAVLAQLDGRPGLDIVALNRGSELARRPSEAWVFAGGGAPVRTAVLRAGLGGRAVAVVDLDRDEHPDIVTVTKDEPRVDVFYGDGAGRFPRSATVTVNGASEIVTSDLDGDGATDLLVRGEGLHLVRGGSGDGLVATPIDAPADFHDVHAVSVDDDERRDVLGLSGGTVVALRQTQPMSFEETRLAAIEGLAIHRLTVADLTGDGHLDAAALVRGTGDTGPWELVVIRHVTEPRTLLPGPDAALLKDAPLTLHVALR